MATVQLQSVGLVFFPAFCLLFNDSRITNQAFILLLPFDKTLFKACRLQTDLISNIARLITFVCTIIFEDTFSLPKAFWVVGFALVLFRKNESAIIKSTKPGRCWWPVDFSAPFARRMVCVLALIRQGKKPLLILVILGSHNGREPSDNGTLSNLPQESRNGMFPLSPLSPRRLQLLTLLQVLVHTMPRGRQAWLRQKLKLPRENFKSSEAENGRRMVVFLYVKAASPCAAFLASTDMAILALFLR